MSDPKESNLKASLFSCLTFSTTGMCSLFDCGSVSDFRCKFDAHETFMTGMLTVDRADFDATRRSHQDKHESNLKALYADEKFEDEPSKGKDKNN